MREYPKANEIYRHFKGNCYRIVTLATHTESRETLVIYQALYGDCQIYARELSMFMSPVDERKYPEVSQKWRFELLTPEFSQISGGALGEAHRDVRPTFQQPPADEQPPADKQTSVDEQVMKYLDADTYREKLEILMTMKDHITDGIINTMAIAIDVEIPEGELQSRFDQLKYCLSTKERFECSRLR